MKIQKYINILTFTVLVVFQVWFLGAALWESTDNILALAFLSLVAFLVTPAYFEVYRRSSRQPVLTSYDHFLVLAVMLGAVSAYILNINIGLGPVVASALVGLAASFLSGEFPAAIYCGSFVGMSSALVLGNLWLAGLAGLVAGIVYAFSDNVFKGVGGKLGTIAFVGVATVAILLY